MRRFVWILLFAACLLSCRRAAPDQIYQEALSLYRQGKYDLALEAATRGVNTVSETDDPNSYWRLLMLRCRYLIVTRRYPEAQAILARQIPPSVTQTSLRQMQRMLEGYLALRNGSAQNARAILSEVKQQTTDRDLLIQVQNLLAATAQKVNDFGTAETEMRTGLALARERQDSYEESAVLLNLSYLRLRQNRFDEARQFSEQSRDAAQRGGHSYLAALALGNLASALYRLGDFEGSLQARQQEQPVLANGGFKAPLADSYGELANAYVISGEPDQALPYFQKAIALSRDVGDPGPIALWTRNLASAYIDAGKPELAAPLIQEARRFNELKPDPVALGYLQSHEAGIALARQDYVAAEAAFRATIASATQIPSLTWSAHGGLARVYRQSGRPHKAREEFEAALAVVEGARERLLADTSKLTFLTSLVRFYHEYVAFLLEQGDEAKALTIADSSRARVLTGRPWNSAPLSQPALTALARRANAAILSYWLAPEGSSVWVISAKGIRRIPLPGDARIRQLAEQHRRLIEENSVDPRQTPMQAGHELFDTLVKPALADIPASGRVILIPDGPLHTINFDTLPTPEGEYWIEKTTISIAPALSVLAATAPSSKGQGLLLVGDPIQADRNFPKLAYAGAELAGIRKEIAAKPVEVLQDASATPAAYFQADPARYSIIHFAAHAQANNASPLDSAIILSPDKASARYKLYASDILDRPLNAKLVTISACRSAGSRAFTGEGLVGFAWAFLRAGASSVIAGLWDVGDSSTSEIMIDLYRNLSPGQSPAVALHAAKLRMVRSASNYRKPFYWAPFQVYETTVR
jgi:CHAT domain-containing protein